MSALRWLPVMLMLLRLLPGWRWLEPRWCCAAVAAAALCRLLLVLCSTPRGCWAECPYGIWPAAVLCCVGWLVPVLQLVVSRLLTGGGLRLRPARRLRESARG